MKAWKYGLLVVTVMGCSSSSVSDTRLQHIDATLDSLRSMGIRIRATQLYASPQTLYVMSDVDRDSKTVGTFITATPVARGDRLFLGDDMWDVKFVKVFGTQVDTAQTSTITQVELLVSYVGKAKDPKSKN